VSIREDVPSTVDSRPEEGVGRFGVLAGPLARNAGSATAAATLWLLAPAHHPDAAEYRAWIREVAGALQGVAATVVLESDAVPHEVSGWGRVEGRPELLTVAVEVLKAAGPVAVYVDAGNPGFVTDTGAIADALKRSGVGRATASPSTWPTTTRRRTS
jgi:hypothetical protein